MKLQHDEITTEKIGKVWVAKTKFWAKTPFLKIEVIQKGETETEAKFKLIKFLNT